MTIKIKDRSYTDEDIIKCLATCEKVISKNAYLEKKWKNCYPFADCSSSAQYAIGRREWVSYRKQIRSLLLDQYSMKEIIRKTKVCNENATQKQVKEIISLLA